MIKVGDVFFSNRHIHTINNEGIDIQELIGSVREGGGVQAGV